MKGRRRLDGMGDDRVEVDGLLAELDLPARDPRDVEQVFEQPGHVLDLPPGDLERLGHLGDLGICERMICRVLASGASGLRSSWASIARNSSLRRSASCNFSAWRRSCISIRFCR